MRSVTSKWIESDDADLVADLRAIGLGRLAEESGVSKSHLSRWLRSQCGMEESKTVAVLNAGMRLRSEKQ